MARFVVCWQFTEGPHQEIEEHMVSFTTLDEALAKANNIEARGKAAGNSVEAWAEERKGETRDGG